MYQEVIIEHSTDIARLKRDADAIKNTQQLPPRAEREDRLDAATEPQVAPFPTTDTVIIYNATLVTMATGELRWDLIEHGLLVTQGGVIIGAGRLENSFTPGLATAINAHGGDIDTRNVVYI